MASVTEVCVCALFVIYFVMLPCFGQLPEKKTYHAVKEDLPYVKCDVCQKTVKYLYRKISEMREKAPAKKLNEEQILNEVEKVCNPDSEQGDWITKLDILEKDNKLKIEEHPGSAKCKSECKTIARACEETVSDVDTDLAELLWKNKHTLSQLINVGCYSLSSACKKKPDKLKKKRSWDEKFEEMTDEERQANEMMKKMSGMPGMPGMSMYSKDELEQMRDAMQGDKEEQPKTQVHDKDIGLLQTIIDALIRLWEWIKNLFVPHFTNEL